MYSSLQPLQLRSFWDILQNQPLKARSIVLSTLGWSVFIAYTVLHCQFYVTYILQEQPGLVSSIFWSFKQYGIWLVLTPALFVAYSRLWPKQKKYCVGAFLLAIAIAVIYRLALTSPQMLAITDSTHLIKNLVHIVPSQLSCAIFVLISWTIFMRSPYRSSSSVDSNVLSNSCSSKESIDTTKTLNVQTGTQQVDLLVANIESITAAGNYMDVCDGKKTYIVRATMKELEEDLQAEQFIRIHRSYLINRTAIDTFDGHQCIKMKSGKTLSVSKRYKINLS